MVIDVTQTPEGMAFLFDGAAAVPLPWVESWTFRRGSSLLMFRRNGSTRPGGHFTLKRQQESASDVFVIDSVQKPSEN